MSEEQQEPRITGRFTVLRAFLVAGAVVQPGETVQLDDYYLARDLLALGRIKASDNKTRLALWQAGKSPRTTMKARAAAITRRLAT